MPTGKSIIFFVLIILARERVTWGYRQVIDVDLKSCFDSLPHDGIVAAVERRINDPWILRLIRRWLASGVLEEGAIHRTVAGSPQGGPQSPAIRKIPTPPKRFAFSSMARRRSSPSVWSVRQKKTARPRSRNISTRAHSSSAAASGR